MLRSFLTAVTIGSDATSTYNGSNVHVIADYAKPEIGDSTQLLGALRYTASSKNVGNYNGANLSIDGLYSTQQGYDISYATSASLRIIPKEISQVDGITAENRTYDGATGATLNTQKSRFNGLIDGDMLTVSEASASFRDKNAGLAKDVDVTGITLGGADAGNYTLANTTATVKADISKAEISSVSGITAQNRTYDGTISAVLNTQDSAFNGMVVGDELTVSKASASFRDKNAAIGKDVDITDIELGGADAGNYSLANTTAKTKADIFKAEISSVSGITTLNRTYDGTTGVELHTDKASFAGLLAGDTLSVDQASGSMLDKNAGQRKEVAITGITLTGDDAGNYALKNDTATATVDIAKAEIAQVAGITAQNRTYDSKTGVELHTDKASFAGLLAGDTLGVDQAIGNMLDKNAGDGRKVNITGITLVGDDAGNYTLKNDKASTWVNIAKAEITQVDGITAQNRIYDSKTGIELHTDKASFAGLLAGDSLSVDKASGSMLDKNADQRKEVAITGITLTGDDAGNYALKNDTATTTVNIAKAEIAQVAGITAQNRTYDSKTGVELHTDKASFAGLLAGDTLSVDQASGSMLDKNAGQRKEVAITGITLTGDDAGNYALKNTKASTWVDIARAEITQVEGITAQNRTYDGTTGATLNTQDSGFNGMVMGDELMVSKASASFRDKNADRGKDVDITGITLGGADARNYSLANTTATAKANIDKATISSVSGITALNRTYDGTTGATLNTQDSGFNGMVMGDELMVSKASASFRDKNADRGKDVDITGITLGGADARNYSLANTTAATKADIDRLAVEARISADGKTYDASSAAVTHGLLGGVLGDDRVSLATSGSFADKNAGSAKAVSVSGALGGADAGNYRLVHNETTTADIAQRAITASISADSKTEDGNANAGTRGSLAGVLDGDQVLLTTTGQFAEAGAGSGKIVYVSGQLEGADAGNYRLAHNATSSADILAARKEDRPVQDAIHSSISQQLRAPAVATGATAQTLGCVFEIHAVVDTGIRLPAGAGPAASRAADAVDAAATCAPPR
ncbi:YDG domain-containing protein [Comamonas antarctica]|uniref:YDG domain-containing protein n=1 Tax=Comamonas antarctica TaxID=2743470 RepID=UPI0028E4B915|nr:YDG domain-containing protein [Comamonas antarctica]